MTRVWLGVSLDDDIDYNCVLAFSSLGETHLYFGINHVLASVLL